MAFFRCGMGSGKKYDDYKGKTVTAKTVSSDDTNTYLTIPKEGIYDETSKICTPNSNLGNQFAFFKVVGTSAGATKIVTPTIVTSDFEISGGSVIIKKDGSYRLNGAVFSDNSGTSNKYFIDGTGYPLGEANFDHMLSLKAGQKLYISIKCDGSYSWGVCGAILTLV